MKTCQCCLRQFDIDEEIKNLCPPCDYHHTRLK